MGFGGDGSAISRSGVLVRETILGVLVDGSGLVRIPGHVSGMEIVGLVFWF